MRTLPQDLRDAFRHLGRERGFTLVAVLTLGLGIGANTAMFSLVRAVLLQPFPYGAPERVALVWSARDRSEVTRLSLQEVASYGRATTLASMAAYTETDANLTGGGDDPEKVRVGATTASLFDVLQVPALLGRTFTPGDGRIGAPEVVVLGYGLWQRRFGGDTGVVGRAVSVNGRPRTIVGVMPASFHLPLDYASDQPTDAWWPLPLDESNLGEWGDRSFIGVARLRDGVPAAQATSEFAVIAGQWVRAGLVADQGDGRLARAAVPVQEVVSGGVRLALIVLVCAVGFVLLIACANVANLLLARAEVRRREVAVRAALGASRRDLVRHSLVESLTLAALGGACGVLLGWAVLQLVVAFRPAGLPRLDEVAIDPAVLAITVLVSVGAGVLFGLAPALHLSRPNLAHALGDGGRSGTAGRSRQALRRTLVVVQVASSVVLAVTAGLLLRSLVELTRVDLGFDPRHVLTAQVQLPASSYADPEDVVRFYRQLVERLGQLPGVSAAGAVRILPLSREIGDWSITIEGRPFDPVENPNGDFQAVTPGYFPALGLTLAGGRALSEADREDAPMAVVINETMAARYWPGEEAIGKRFRMGTLDQPWMTIVGVTRDVRHNAVTESPRAEMYVPHAQLPAEVGSTSRAMTLVVRAGGDPLALAGPLRDAVRRMDPNLPVSNIRAMTAVTAAALSTPRFTAGVLGLFAALALALAGIGIYGTVALLVSARTQELGIRLALGARRAAVVRLVLGQGLVLTAAGLGAGLAGAAALARTIGTLLYGVNAFDPITFGAVPLLLAAVALAACLLPARRAATLDPAITLRN